MCFPEFCELLQPTKDCGNPEVNPSVRSMGTPTVWTAHVLLVRRSIGVCRVPGVQSSECGKRSRPLARWPGQFLTRLTERFVLGVDLFVETLWKVWTELLDVLGLDVSNLSQYFSPASVANSPARALLLVGVILLAYWFLSLTLGFTFGVLHLLFGRFFWVVRVLLFSMSCVYVLHKHEGEPEHAVLPLCFVVAVYFMTGPMGVYWRGSSGPGGPGVEEKLEHLENQVRLLNIRLNRVLESLDRPKDK
ncbi:BRI3-binding protein [Tupaia chinensis]|uniref:BRI3-binding protein n=1 Tax=Tupaia chinensis TaxID=246437 RepID=UPI0003C908B7|nr:BRI3-binding protein [Tupaia chinensis]